MFNKSPQNLFAAVFNVPQGAVMTLAMSLRQGATDIVSLLRAFVCAYCAGVMLTVFLRVPDWGEWVAKKLRCDRQPALHYIVSNFAGGAIMGIFMNFFMTFMMLGPVPVFPAAYFSSLPYAMLVSGVSSCLWIGPALALVKRRYGGEEREP